MADATLRVADRDDPSPWVEETRPRRQQDREDPPPDTQAVTPLEWMRALRNAGFTGGALNVLLMLALRMRKDGAGFASQRQLAKDAGVSESTVKRAIKLARSGGYVQQTRRGHRVTDGTSVASEYRLVVPTQPVTDDTLGDDPTGHGCHVGNGSQPVISKPNRSSGPSQPVTGDPPSGLPHGVFYSSVPEEASGATVVAGGGPAGTRDEYKPTDTEVVELAVTLLGNDMGLDEDDATDLWHEWRGLEPAQKSQLRGRARQLLRAHGPDEAVG
jgi:biotin operon repressor